ncbi:type IV pilus twitching motility protein PilT [Terribacillus saccharophilus]|uniref:Type IV pili twitching motility protein PilT n=1 Tax=Terribacillus saccharophilus TaxID=361277 RepID=A0ABX4H123_9BACI|nr:type IV pilus twitching motility protein PilT [Terribacillus saccharophilus]PAD36429.1 type IV pili twitching motility protein PilT [Terribacillus saccharophilus]PAD97093.1 type IV pili twitching motility protein PilT [Terribacillus saccharophilus]PAE00841.1 type IV pili twitching motility protein PilT [Terribacillus saccharophilus]
MKETFDELLITAMEIKASDIHMTVAVPPVFRVHGVLRRHHSENLTPADTEQMAKAILSEKLWERFKEVGEVDLSYSIPGVSRFRINVYHQRGCVSLAVRVVPRNVPTLEDLDLPDVLKVLSGKPQGLLLVTGPTGSGKSTTLAAMIHHMNTSMQRHIITLEDPIEYLHKHNQCIIDQREVGLDTDNFANGLRACLRQDPDVILVGELRDLETISTAITAAETGHLVLATLHTSSASQTIDRIVDVFPAEQQPQIRIQLASVLTAVLSQRLVRRSDGQGRKALTELLISTSAIKNLIRNGKMHQIPSIMQTSRDQGMHTMDMSIRKMVASGIVTMDQVAPFLEEWGV